MATVVAENPTYTGPNDGGGYNEKGGQKLPELRSIIEEEPGDRPASVASRKGDEDKEELQLPPIVSAHKTAISTESLMEKLGLAGGDEKSLGIILKSVRAEVKAALEELTAITTHDDNLEKQYRETLSENTDLQSALDRARREIRHLKGQLSILRLTPSEIREERARTQHKEKRRQELEKQTQGVRGQSSERGAAIQVLTVAERARTVNAKGEYIDKRQGQSRSKHSRRSTYPVPGSRTKQAPPTSSLGAIKSKLEPLPPPLIGCTCSECNAQQSLGVLTLNRSLCQHQSSNQVTKSGQQVLLGDRVVLRGERLGAVCYIGRLDFDLGNQIYIGVHLDLPVGNIDGYLKGRRYFQCPPGHGVMVKANDIVCVTGRKPFSGGTAVPRVREKLPTGLEISRSVSKASRSKEESPYITRTPSSSSHSSHSTLSHARATVEGELARLGGGGHGENSVNDMSKRIHQLSEKSSKKARELQKLQEELKLRPPPTPPPITVNLDESVNLPLSHPPPRPITPQPITPTPPHTAEPSRPPTPMEHTLLQLLSDKDLGATGFVTSNELTAALMQLPRQKGLSIDEVTQLFARVGVSSEEGVGLPYRSLVPYIVRALEDMQQ